DPPRRGARERRLRAARARRQRREGRALAAGRRAGGGLRRLRDRALDLVGCPQGLPRRRPRARGGGRAGRREVPALRGDLRRRGVRRARLNAPEGAAAPPPPSRAHFVAWITWPSSTGESIPYG